jgi:hypothetical protein
MSLWRSESVIFLVDSLYTDAIEAVETRPVISASTLELFWILGEIISKVKFWKPPNLWIYF